MLNILQIVLSLFHFKTSIIKLFFVLFQKEVLDSLILVLERSEGANVVKVLQVCRAVHFPCVLGTIFFCHNIDRSC